MINPFHLVGFSAPPIPSWSDVDLLLDKVAKTFKLPYYCRNDCTIVFYEAEKRPQHIEIPQVLQYRLYCALQTFDPKPQLFLHFYSDKCPESPPEWHWGKFRLGRHVINLGVHRYRCCWCKSKKKSLPKDMIIDGGGGGGGGERLIHYNCWFNTICKELSDIRSLSMDVIGLIREFIFP